MASQISSLQSITNTASSTSLSPSLANLNGLSSPKPQAQLRRMTTSVLPPPTSLNLVLLIDHIFLLNRHLTASHSLNLSMDTLGTPQDHPGGHHRPFVTSSLTEDSQMIATLETVTTTKKKNIHGHAAAPPRLRRSHSSRRTSQTASIPSSVPR
jgi:hypothetical protein